MDQAQGVALIRTDPFGAAILLKIRTLSIAAQSRPGKGCNFLIQILKKMPELQQRKVAFLKEKGLRILSVSDFALLFDPELRQK